MGLECKTNGPHLVDRSNQGEVVCMVNAIGTTNLGGLHIYLAIYLYNNILSGHRGRRKKSLNEGGGEYIEVIRVLIFS